MDKIREEFEKEYKHSYDGKSIQFIVFQSGYHVGYKSRDEKIKKLRDALKKIVLEVVPYPDTQAYYFQEIARKALKDGE